MKYSYAVWNLVQKDFKTRYRSMSLGLIWSVLNPLIMLGVLVIVFGYIGAGRQIENFPVFILLGLIHYNFFSNTVNSSTLALQSNRAIIKKLNFPKSIIPLSLVLSQSIHLLIMLVILIGFAVAFRIPFTLYTLLLLPSILIEMTFILGLSWFLASVTVFFKDMKFIVQSSMTMLFWFTPIFYPIETARERLPPILYALFRMNPLAGCIHTSRSGLLYQQLPDTSLFLHAVFISLGVFVGGYLFLVKTEKWVGDRL